MRASAENKLPGADGSYRLPRYYLNIRRPSGAVTRDPEGYLVPSLDAAYREAIDSVRDLRREYCDGENGADIDGWAIDVCDGMGRVLMTVPFSEVTLRE